MFVTFARDYIDHVKSSTGASKPTLLPERSGPAARKVFIVHGHNEGARESVARFLEQLDFDPIILHEQANQGGPSLRRSRLTAMSASRSCF
jgi:hypothetical protein